MPDIDRAGFVPRETCYCSDGCSAVYDWERGHWHSVDGYALDENPDGDWYACGFCRAELAVFTDPDGTRRPMVRRAGFWRDVALDLSRILPRGKAELQWAVRRAMAADGLNAQAAGETMGAAERTEIQWSGKPESEVRE